MSSTGAGAGSFLASRCARACTACAAGSQGRRSRKFSIRPGITPSAATTSSSTSGENGRVPSRQWFSRLSTDQEKSPMSLAPTMRPLPLSVWKPRRTSCHTPVLPTSFLSFGRYSRNCPSTSLASSTKMPRISGSISSGADAVASGIAAGVATAAAAGAGGATGAGAWACIGAGVIEKELVSPALALGAAAGVIEKYFSSPALGASGASFST